MFHSCSYHQQQAAFSVPQALSQPTPALPRHQLPDEASWILTKPVCRTPSPSPFPLLLSTILRLRFMRSPTCRQWLCKAWSPLLGLPLPSWQLVDVQWAEHCAMGEMTTRTSTVPCFGPATGRWTPGSRLKRNTRPRSNCCARAVTMLWLQDEEPLQQHAQRRTRATCEGPDYLLYIFT